MLTVLQAGSIVQHYLQIETVYFGLIWEDTQFGLKGLTQSHEATTSRRSRGTCLYLDMIRMNSVLQSAVGRMLKPLVCFITCSRDAGRSSWAKDHRW